VKSAGSTIGTSERNLTKLFLFLSGDSFNTKCATVYIKADITDKSVGLMILVFNVLYLIRFMIKAALMTDHYLNNTYFNIGSHYYNRQIAQINDKHRRHLPAHLSFFCMLYLRVHT
jgi:hypothetical protein